MAGERYTEDHLWARVEGGRVRVGMSAFAQEELGEVAFVELPAAGRSVAAGEAVGVVDSLKSTSELLAPVSGTILESNATLATETGARAINEDPLGAGWLFVIDPADLREVEALMSEERYRAYVAATSEPGGAGR